MGNEEEPFEGEVPIVEVENAIVELIRSKSSAKGGKVRFVFDGFIYQGDHAGQEFIHFTSQFGIPKFLC